MKTDDLVSLLATGVTPVRPNATTRRLTASVSMGLAMSILIVGAGYGFRQDLMAAVLWPMFWIKLTLLVAVGWTGLRLTHRLARPGTPIGAAWLGLVFPVILIWMMAVGALVLAAPQERLPLVLGETWRSCIFNILAASAPLVVTSMVTLRTLAPTRPRLSGAAVGIMAGGMGAAVYALHCPEMAAPFLAVWYVAGMAITIVLSSILGHWLLRW